jgi:hypothetical protein
MANIENKDSESGIPSRRRWGVIVLMLAVPCLALTPFLLFFGAIGIQNIKEHLGRRSFDSVVWKSSLSENSLANPVRLRMVDSLLRRHRLVGMSRAEIAALLGTPHPTEYFRNYDLVYWLGPERGFISIDSEWLVIRFDSNDRVAEARIVRD